MQGRQTPRLWKQIVVVQRLLTDKTVSYYGFSGNGLLKQDCKEHMLVQSGNKYDLLLRLLHHTLGTGTAKRVATETVIIDGGKELQVLKKRAKTILKPETLYTRVQKKIHSVQQKKYQSDSKLTETNPHLVFSMTKAVLQAFYDHWPYMERPGCGSDVFSEGFMVQLETVLKAIQPHLSEQQVTSMVNLLELTEGGVAGYGLEVKHVRRRDVEKVSEWSSKAYEVVRKENTFVNTIRVLRPAYDDKNRTHKPGCSLHRDTRGILWMNGCDYKVPPTYRSDE